MSHLDPQDPLRRTRQEPVGRQRAVTMKEIAAAAGVSQSTISRVLNGRSGDVTISNATRERILSVASELGYRPNPLAAGLRGGGTKLIGVIARDLADPFLAGVVQALVGACQRRGYNVIASEAASSAGGEPDRKAPLETRACEALVLLGDVHAEEQVVRDLELHGLPMVGLCRGARGALISTVNVDNRQGTRDALDHLWALGHRRIAFAQASWVGESRERASEYLDYMRARGQRVPDGYLCDTPHDPAGGVHAIERLVELSPRPTAVFCSTDVIALGALHGAASLGVTVPDELSIVGFDDIGIARFTVPALTTVRQPVAEMVDRALELALGTDGAEAGSPAAAELVVRASTGAREAGEPKPRRSRGRSVDPAKHAGGA
jgi:DNA-binding LacI/PurR family transcriptional regulator